MLGAVSGGVTLISNVVRVGNVLKLLRIPIETVCADLINIVLVCFYKAKEKHLMWMHFFSCLMT